MTTTVPTNQDKVIDSRDVIARIEELTSGEEVNRQEVADLLEGFHEIADNDESDRQEAIKTFLATLEDNAAQPEAIGEGEKQVRNLLDAWNATMTDPKIQPLFTDETFAHLIDDLHKAADDWRDWHEDYADELATLKSLAEEGENSSDEWEDGVTLILDSHFQEYAQDYADEIGATNAETEWPGSYIDWEKASSALQEDYSCITFDGADYWIR